MPLDLSIKCCFSSLLWHFQAHASKMYYPRYQFIFLGWYDANWWVGSEDQQASLMEEYQCSVEDRQRVMQYSLAIDKDEFLGDDDSFTVDSGLVR